MGAPALRVVKMSSDEPEGAGRQTEPFAMVPASALRKRGLSHGAIHTLALLHDYAGPQGRCWPSLSQLQEDLCDARGTVIGYLTELKERGYIRSERRGQGKSNIYHLLSPRPQAGSEVSKTELQDVPENELQGAEVQPGGLLDVSETGLLVVQNGHVSPPTPPPICAEEPEPKNQNQRTRTKASANAEGTPPLQETQTEPTAQNHESPSASSPKKATVVQQAAAPRVPVYADWVDPLIDRIGAAIEWRTVGEKTRQGWRPLLEPLGVCSPEERERFPAWLASGNEFWKGRGFQLGHSLRLECEAFVSAGMPLSKPERSNSRPRNAPPEERPLDDVPHIRVENCCCGVAIGGKRPHGERCGLTGPVTRENCLQPWKQNGASP